MAGCLLVCWTNRTYSHAVFGTQSQYNSMWQLTRHYSSKHACKMVVSHTCQTGYPATATCQAAAQVETAFAVLLMMLLLLLLLL